MHARANALLLTSSLPGAVLLRALNGVSPEVFFSAARGVPTGFSVRTAKWRWYRYFEPAEGRNIDRWKEAAALFHEHIDVRSFGRDIPSEAPVWREIDRVTVSTGREVIRTDLRAPSFVWREVRKIVAGLRAYDRGELSLPDLKDAIEGHRRLTLPMAEPERLVLWEVRVPTRTGRSGSIRPRVRTSGRRGRPARRPAFVGRYWMPSGRARIQLELSVRPSDPPPKDGYRRRVE